MKKSDINHLRRLVAWVSAEIGQSPDELVMTMRDIANKLGHPDLDDSAKARLVEAHDKARSVPKYVRNAVTALEKYLQTPGEIVAERQDAPKALSVDLPPDEEEDIEREIDRWIKHDPKYAEINRSTMKFLIAKRRAIFFEEKQLDPVLHSPEDIYRRCLENGTPAEQTAAQAGFTIGYAKGLKQHDKKESISASSEPTSPRNY